jgi:hypothetical protein
MAWSRLPITLLSLPALPLSALVSTSALAELGGSSAAVQSDQTHMRAQLRAVRLSNHTRHELSLPNGGSIHEFTNDQGQVFAITWSGPGKPDLRSLLGRYFATFQSASSSDGRRRSHFMRRPVAVNRSDLQINAGGHMGYFWGVAYLPSLAPAGFSISELETQ